MIIDDFGWEINDYGLAPDCILGIDSITSLSVFIYPNPTKSTLYIEGSQNPVDTTIYNLLGKEVLSSNSQIELM
jgi:hypothetical protein